MEFKRSYLEMKRYSVNTISSLLNEFIFIFGLFYMFKNKNNLSFNMVIVIGCWYVFQNVIMEMVGDLETEIRAETLMNLIVSNSSLLFVFFKRSIFVFFKTFTIFGFTIFFFHKDIVFNDICTKNIFIFLILILIFFYLIFYIFFSLGIIFERISTFTAFISSIIIIFSNKIKILNEIYKLIIGKEINYLLIFKWYVILILCLMVLIHFAFRKINKLGI